MCKSVCVSQGTPELMAGGCHIGQGKDKEKNKSKTSEAYTNTAPSRNKRPSVYRGCHDKATQIGPFQPQTFIFSSSHSPGGWKCTKCPPGRVPPRPLSAWSWPPSPCLPSASLCPHLSFLSGHQSDYTRVTLLTTLGLSHLLKILSSNSVTF